MKFQKDLIVWKRFCPILMHITIQMFQKDLIVWKLLRIYTRNLAYYVSEGLNSVETEYIVYVQNERVELVEKYYSSYF